MILQALYEYYQRKAADPGSTIAPHGLEWEFFRTTGYHRGGRKTETSKKIPGRQK